MKRNRKVMARVLSLTMATVMALGLSVTAFAAGSGDDNDQVKQDSGQNNTVVSDDHATQNTGYGGYPAGMNGNTLNGSTGTTQYVDRDWIEFPNLTGKVTDEGQVKISVSGITDEGKTVTAYQIVAAQYDATTGNFLKYANVNADYAVVDENGEVAADALTREKIGVLGSAAAAGAFGNGYALDKSGDGTYSRDDVNPGSYVIIVSGSKDDTAESATYGPMIVSAFYYAGGLHTGALKLVENMAFAKRQDAPSIDKQITYAQAVNGVGTGTDSNGDVAVANAGDYVWFDILVKSLPEYHGAHPQFYVTDTISGNLDFDANSVQAAVFFGDVGSKYSAGGLDNDGKFNFVDEVDGVKIIDLDPSDYTVDVNDDTITIDFVKGGDYQLNQYAGYDMVIRYRALVNSDDGEYNGNVLEMPNDAALTYSRNSAVNGDIGTVKDDPVYVYSLKVEAVKTDADDKALEGATFELMPVGPSGPVSFYGDGRAYTTVSNENGDLVFKGIGVGEYILKEVEAPSGFVVSNVEYKITVTADDDCGGKIIVNESNYTAVFADSEEDDVKQILSAGYSYGDNGDGDLRIPNTRMNELPSTGGAGTALLVGLGIVGILACAVVLFGTRKKQED